MVCVFLTHPQGYYQTMYWALFTMESAVTDAVAVVVGDRRLAAIRCILLPFAVGTSPALCSTGQLFWTKVIIASVSSVPSSASFRNRDVNQQSARYSRCG
jgi:hypothetical protein